MASLRAILGRALAALTIAGTLAGTAAAEQGDAADRERLKRLLEDKFGSKSSEPSGGQTRGLSAPSPIDKDDVYVIKPSKPAPSEDAAPRGRSGGLDRGIRFAEAVTIETGTLSDGTLQLAQAAPAEAGEAKAQEPPIVVKRNSFVIQLKPDATAEDIDRILAKYKLRVTKHVPSLGALYVERIDEPRGGGTRGLRPKQQPSATGQSGDSLSSIFEPKIVKDLRNDPAVDAAFVNQSIAPKTVPKASGAKGQVQGGATLKWNWLDGGNDDGNWGLKVLRMPAVWTIIAGLRRDNPGQGRTRVTLLDSGFGKNKQIVYNDIWGGSLPPDAGFSDCEHSHGTHIAGIIGAAFDKGNGIDGMVPDARIEAVPISRELLSESFNDGITDAAQQHVSFFMDAITDLSDYLDQSAMKPGERRVVNISLAYNWSGVTLTKKSRPTDDPVIRDQVRQHAKVVQSLVNRVQDRVLFVAAAGNDSDNDNDPVAAEYASPFAYTGVHQQAGYTASKNIMVVEAKDRDGNRASFSNVGGHVAAPGVDIMSTVAADKFAVCSGTSQATPHVTALAALLFEIDPTKTPAEIAVLIRATAVPVQPPRTGAPRIDALEAVLKLKPDAIKYLADLNGDGKVDAADLKIFKADIIAIEQARFGAEPIGIDLNGDGKIDEYERCYPVIDLNGSGRASYDPGDLRPILGQMRSDLDVLQLAWTDTAKPFDVALKDSGLDDLIQAWQATGLVAAVDAQPAVPCR